MPRPKKSAPNHATGMYEYKATVGRDFKGKAIRKSFYSSKSIEAAKEKARQYIVEHEVAERTGEAFTLNNCTFEQWAHKWLEIYKKPTVTANTYNGTYKNCVDLHLVPYFGKALLKDIKSIDVQNFFNKKQSELSESMLKKLYMIMHAIYDTAIDNDLCYKNPVKGIKFTSQKSKCEKKVYTDEQIITVKQFFYDKCPEIYTLLSTGLRRGELLGLMWSDFDPKNKTLSVNRSIARATQAQGGVEIRPPKMGSYRTIPIDDDLTNLLDSLDHKGDYIFPTPEGNIRAVDSFTLLIRSQMRRLNAQYPDIPPLTAHELRHTRGTQLRRNGVDIYTIQKIMGHADINVTANIYVHDDVETTRKAAKIN